MSFIIREFQANDDCHAVTNGRGGVSSQRMNYDVPAIIYVERVLRHRYSIVSVVVTAMVVGAGGSVESPALSFQTFAAFRTALMRPCQPGPVALNFSITSGSRRREICLRG